MDKVSLLVDIAVAAFKQLAEFLPLPGKSIGRVGLGFIVGRHITALAKPSAGVNDILAAGGNDCEARGCCSCSVSRRGC